MWHTLGANVQKSSNRLQYFVYDEQGSLHLIGVPTSLETGTWYHTVLVSGAGGMKIYLNGMLVGQDPYSDSLSAITDGQFRLRLSGWSRGGASTMARRATGPAVMTATSSATW